MRDLNLDELELVYGAGSSGRSCGGYGDSPTPPSCWTPPSCGGSSKGTKGTKKTRKTKKTKKTKKC